MKITDEIFQIGGSGITSSEDAAVYLIKFSEEAAIVDAGCGYSVDRLMANAQSTGVRKSRIKYLLLTHCHFDHTGGANKIREQSGCQIVAHILDAEYLEKGDDQVTAATWYGAAMQPVAVDRKIEQDRENLPLSDRVIQAIHIPGHSPGSLAYLVESDGLRILFGQDVHGPLDASLKSNRRDYLESLNRLIQLKADILCEGHYGVIKGQKEVEEFIRSFL